MNNWKFTRKENLYSILLQGLFVRGCCTGIIIERKCDKNMNISEYFKPVKTACAGSMLFVQTISEYFVNYKIFIVY